MESGDDAPPRIKDENARRLGQVERDTTYQPHGSVKGRGGEGRSGGRTGLERDEEDGHVRILGEVLDRVVASSGCHAPL